MDGYGPSEDDCWSALMKSAKMKRNGLLYASMREMIGGEHRLWHVVWSVPMVLPGLSRTGG